MAAVKQHEAKEKKSGHEKMEKYMEKAKGMKMAKAATVKKPKK